VTRIALWGAPERPWGSITTSGPVRYRLRDIRPGWIVVDLSPATLDLVSGKPPAAFGRITRVRAGQFNPTTVRVVLELTEAVPVRITSSSDGRAIIISLVGPAMDNAGARWPGTGTAGRKHG
jgi:hypothetical protein